MNKIQLSFMIIGVLSTAIIGIGIAVVIVDRIKTHFKSYKNYLLYDNNYKKLYELEKKKNDHH